MFTDPISDFLTRIRNAQAANALSLSAPASRLKRSIAEVLQREGYIESVEEKIDGQKHLLVVTLKYLNKAPFIRSLRRVSKPGCRVYRRASELPRVLSGQGFLILSTSSGIMTSKEARKRRLGGEVLCEIF